MSLPCNSGALMIFSVVTALACMLLKGEDLDLRRTVDESGRIQRAYGHYFDLNILNDDLDQTFLRLQEALEKLRSEPQWVPVSWVY